MMRRGGQIVGLMIMLGMGCGAKTGPDIPSDEPISTCPISFGTREPPRCELATEDSPLTTFPGTPLAVLTADCDVVVVVVANELHVSTNGGESFATPRELPPDALIPNLGAPRFAPIALAEDGTLHALVEDGGGLWAQRSADLGLSWDEPVLITDEVDLWGPSLVVRGAEIVIFWMHWGSTLLISRSNDAGASFGPVEQLAAGRLWSASYPTVCLPGSRGVVVSWLECTTFDCSGTDRDGLALGMLSVSVDSPFETTRLWEIDNGVRRPIAGCAADGRSFVSWSSAPYLAVDDLVVASVDACGRAVETARFVGSDSPYNSPGSPTPIVGTGGVLLTWVLSFAVGSGIAILDEEGALISSNLDPDFDGDGMYELLKGACANVGGYALITLDETGGPYGPRSGVAVLLDETGAVLATRDLGTVEDYRAGWVSCDGRGRAHFVWSSAGGTCYFAFAPR